MRKELRKVILEGELKEWGCGYVVGLVGIDEELPAFKDKLVRVTIEHLELVEGREDEPS